MWEQITTHSKINYIKRYNCKQVVSELEIRVLNIVMKVTLQGSYGARVCKKMVIERQVTFL